MAAVVWWLFLAIGEFRACDPVKSGHTILGMAQPEAPAFGSSQVIGIALGIGLVVAAFATIAWLKRRSQVARHERPPQRTKILRPPGYSLTCRIDKLADQLTSYVMQAVGAGAVLGLAGTALYPLIEGLVLRRFSFAEIRSHPQSYILLSVTALALSALAWTIRSVIQAAKIHGSIRNCRFGLRGEQAVAEALADGVIAAAGYVAFHDVPGDSAWNIDHIVVGPGGIFVLETKTRSRRKPTREQPDHEVWFDGQNLQFPWCTDRDAAIQAKRNAEWVRRFISGFGPKEMLVHPVVVIPGWYVRTQGKHPVKAMNAKYLVTGYLPSFERQFSPHQLQSVVRRLDERCRDLEF
jgi:nuclease-like protein